MLRNIVVADEVKMMMSTCQRLKIVHKLVCEWSKDEGAFGSYVVKFYVGDACMKDGWMEVSKFDALVQWISSKRQGANQ